MSKNFFEKKEVHTTFFFPFVVPGTCLGPWTNKPKFLQEGSWFLLKIRDGLTLIRDKFAL